MYRTVTVQVAVFFRWAAALPVGSTQNPFPSVVPSRCDGSGVLFHSGVQWTQSEVGCRINVVTTEDSVAGAQRVADVCRALAEAEA